MAESGSKSGSETLQLSEVLQGAGADAEAAVWLHFSYDAASDATTVDVKSQAEAGELAEAKIVLAGVNLTALGSDGTIVSHLLSGWNSHCDG